MRRTPMSWCGVFLGFATMFLSAAAASAQSGSISGTVKDPSGGVMPGVTVTATRTTLSTQFTATTDGQGFYSLPKLPVGRYDLLIQIEGFKPQKRSDLSVDTD